MSEPFLIPFVTLVILFIVGLLVWGWNKISDMGCAVGAPPCPPVSVEESKPNPRFCKHTARASQDIEWRLEVNSRKERIERWKNERRERAIAFAQEVERWEA